MNAKKLFSKDVIDTDGNKVGKITDIDLDMERGGINYFIVSTGFLKKGELKIDQIKSIGDTILLKIPKAELEKK